MAAPSTTIDLRLFATLAVHAPPNAARYPINPGTTIEQLLAAIGVEAAAAKLIFINGLKGALDTPLNGGERVGIFPPVGGG